MLEVAGVCRVPPYQGIGVPFEGDDSGDALAMHALVAGIPIGHQVSTHLMHSLRLSAFY